MELSEESIKQFIQGQLSIKEAKEVVALLDANPNWVNQYFTETEWDAIRETEIEKLSQEKLQQVFALIQSKAFVNDKQKAKPRVIYMWVAAASVAAAVLLFFVSGWWLRENLINKSTVVTIVNNTLYRYNNTDTVQLFALSDGSSIELNPKSSVSYLQQFPKERRVIKLIGNALFKVAKDKHRPFEVQAAGFSTVALGTSFRVIANPNETIFTVKLYTGKVVISKTDSSIGSHFNNIFLYPNQQLVINTVTSGSDVALINTNGGNNNEEVVNEKATPSKKLDWDKYIVDNQLKFASTPLSTIFSVVEYHYNISIICEPSVIQGIVFSGTFNKGDQVQTVLTTLTSINHLNLLKRGKNQYKVTK